ncbi:hypothetical protein TSUD_30910 [Trifolium subterraneum]|uniref:RNase H type-1 domain-containing protein n=1 Tax=Trifolium subterraneum TaxID=3900 RepID=A0A2Z6N9D4_TRISU|nr:hypothetical protein TSUD_30910 [Trifolium subterraneum]
MEKLSIAINDAVHQGTWASIHIFDNGRRLSHLLLADDVLLFTTANNSQLRFVTDLFARFSSASTCQSLEIAWFPQSICDNIDQATRNFIWRDSNNKGIHLVGWNKIARPKQCGGLGIRPTKEANISLLEKHVWDMVQSSSKLWVDLLSSKYTAGKNLLLTSNPSSGSSTWSSIIRAKDILKEGFSWRADSGSSSFWFTPWTALGRLGSLVPYVDIHDLQLSVKDVLSIGNPHTQSLYTQLPPLASDIVNNANFKFNDSIEDAFIWTNNKNDTYTTKSGYNWLLSLRDLVINHNPSHSWSWIWKIQLPEKIKFFFWLACHNFVPTLSLLNHRKMSHSATCTRCGLQDESFLHCIRDCEFARSLWNHIGFNNMDFFSNMDVYDWLKLGATGSQTTTFSTGVWWSWRHRNLMCLNNENWSLSRLSFNIGTMVETFRSSFSPASNETRLSPDRYGFGGIIRNTFGHYIAGFSDFIQGSSDILLVELYAIYKGILLAKDKSIDELVCYYDSLNCVNLIKGPHVKYRIHAVLIQDMKELLSQTNVSLHHTLREENQCADFFAKLGASSNADFLIHAFPPKCVRDLLKNDTMGTFFFRD